MLRCDGEPATPAPPAVTVAEAEVTGIVTRHRVRQE